ncbi:MAG TPA: hypothetical protein PKE55_14110 [Kiritimatiellia bacterium]|nr:hypothetical protein [Kiritimatiellia bacterium]
METNRPGLSLSKGLRSFGASSRKDYRGAGRKVATGKWNLPGTRGGRTGEVAGGGFPGVSEVKIVILRSAVEDLAQGRDFYEQQGRTNNGIER